MSHIAYIDEAGDEGLTKLREQNSGQSNWLILGGLLVSDEVDRQLPAIRDGALSLFADRQSRDLHFRKLKHDQKVALSDYLGRQRMGVCCICSNKSTLLDGGKYEALYQQKGHLYNYLTRFLLERLTRAISAWGKKEGRQARLKIVFSRRANTDYHAMREYLESMRDGKEKLRPVRSIDWSVFSPSDIVVENHSRWAGLQLADNVTSAVFNALEPNRYGYTEPRYALSLAKRMLTERKLIRGCGITLLPNKCPLTEDQARFVTTIQERWQAPGP